VQIVFGFDIIFNRDKGHMKPLINLYLWMSLNFLLIEIKGIFAFSALVRRSVIMYHCLRAWALG
jgi:hypothetical protein